MQIRHFLNNNSLFIPLFPKFTPGYLGVPVPLEISLNGQMSEYSSRNAELYSPTIPLPHTGKWGKRNETERFLCPS